jgi:DNA processing protein
MIKDELIAVLRLQNIPNIGDVSAKKLITHCGSAMAVFSDRSSHLLKIDGIGQITVRGMHDAEHLEAAEEEYQYIHDNNVDYFYFSDREYPNYL